jgi:transposase-like protein
MFELATNHAEEKAPEVTETLDELARVGARRMIAEALELEVEQHIQKMRGLRDEEGHALVVRNGRARERRVTLGADVVKIRAPRVHDRRPGHRFSSRILPPYMRRSPRVEEALPVLYLRGLSENRHPRITTWLQVVPHSS